MRTKFKINIPDDIVAINKVFKKHGFKLFLVGGAVRDAILNEPIKDFDLATNAEPDTVEKIMQDAGFTTLATGKAFGVINVFTKDNEFEIATFRTDSKESDGRRPNSVKFTTIKGDVLRRDLTINALFYDLNTKEVVDYVGGIEDISKKIVRTVGPAKDRFSEDKLRILRAIRFAGRFGSYLHQDIQDTLRADNSLEGISGERIHDEFLKGLKTSKSVIHFLEMIDRFNLFDWIFPNLKINKLFIEEKDPMVVIAKLLNANDLSTLGKKLNSLKFSTSEIDIILFLIKYSKIELNQVVDLKREQKKCDVTDEQIIRTTANSWVALWFTQRFLEFNLTVTGEFVMQEFDLKPGPEVGEKIKELELINFSNT